MNEAFRHKVIYPKETKYPVKQITSNSFLFVQESDVFVVGVTRHNADASVIFEVLHTLIKNCKLYFGGDFDEESIRGNFLLVYEILDGTLFTPPFPPFKCATELANFSQHNLRFCPSTPSPHYPIQFFNYNSAKY